MNGFVRYLNSMNSAESESMNALAESQLMTEYYSKIEVKREISNTITSYLKDSDNREAIILTGHAGDGKTSILVQVLEAFGYFDEGKKPLKISDEFNDLYYVKDMSELSIKDQNKLLKKFLDCRKEGKSAIIVSNTGPIINAFKDLFDEVISNEDIEKKILHGIDNIRSDRISIQTEEEEYSFRIVNIANIDNSYMIEQILLKVLNKDLWRDCDICNNQQRCPIYNNYKMISENLNDIADKIGKLYFWLSERGTRLTIRQMIAHITFSLTSNLDCERVCDFSDNGYALDKYSFANSFFGEYQDKNLKYNALNIKTIKELNVMGLDKRTLGKFDDELFIKENFNIFPIGIKNRIKSIINFSDVGVADNKVSANDLRREIRRYFILFSKNEENNVLIDNAIINEPFMDYYRAVTDAEDFSKAMMRKINSIVFVALYRYFIGVYPTKDEEYLYVTLRKDFNVIQNTQMLIAKVPKDQIKVVREKIEDKDKVEQEKVKYKMVLKIGDKGKFDISSEFLEYMFKFYEGYVFTNLHPSFSYGISKLKTQIMKEYNMDDSKLTLIIIQNDKVNKMKIQIAHDGIIVD